MAAKAGRSTGWMSVLCLVVGSVTPLILAVFWAIFAGQLRVNESVLDTVAENLTLSVLVGTLLSLINVPFGLLALEQVGAAKGIARAGIGLSAVTLGVLAGILTLAVTFSQ